jgi:hypothetical protein
MRSMKSESEKNDGVKGLRGSVTHVDWQKQTEGQKVRSLGLHFPKRERDGA